MIWDLLLKKDTFLMEHTDLLGGQLDMSVPGIENNNDL